MYEHCGVLGFFKGIASANAIKKEANKNDVCGSGTAWDKKQLQCVTSLPKQTQTSLQTAQQTPQQYDDVANNTPRTGKCECNGKPSLKNTFVECASAGCVWTPWNDVISSHPSTSCGLDAVNYTKSVDGTCANGETALGVSADAVCVPNSELNDYYCALACVSERTEYDAVRVEAMCQPTTSSEAISCAAKCNQ